MIKPYNNIQPTIHPNTFIAPDAWIIGDVEIAEDVSIFFNVVIRGDIQPIRIGRGSNVQEHSLLHTSRGRSPTIVGEQVVVGHRAIIHGCTIGNRCLVGMGAIILDDTVIGDESLIAAGTVIAENKKFPPRSLIMGVPGKVVRTLSDEEVKRQIKSAEEYVITGRTLKKIVC